MSQENQGFFDSLLGKATSAVNNFSMDDFSTLAGHAIEYKKAKRRDPASSRNDVVQLATTPQVSEPNNEIQPISASQIRHQMEPPAKRTAVGGFVVDKNLLIGGAAILGMVVLLKVVK